jgi:hypothetical protein
MNRSRLIAAGTSVGALVAITAGVAAANPAPTNNHATPPNGRATTTNNDRPSRSSEDFGSDDQGQDNWQQLPPDPSATDPGLGSSSGQPAANQPPASDPNTGSNSGGSNTSSGGS